MTTTLKLNLKTLAEAQKASSAPTIPAAPRSGKCFVGLNNGTGLSTNMHPTEPELKGCMVYVNGYDFSVRDAMNAIFNRVPEKTHRGFQGISANEGQDLNPKHQEDIDDRYSPNEEKRAEKLELKRQAQLTLVESVLEAMEPCVLTISSPGTYHKKPIFSKKNSSEKRQRMSHYWNEYYKKDGQSNKEDEQFTNTYAEYFDAADNISFINGSHSLQSSAMHRMEHGSIQGYAWAKGTFNFCMKKDYEKFKKAKPNLPTPKDRPVTIVMHSQGNAMGLGVVAGIAKYLNELGWDEMPINLVMLSVHQNRALQGEEYNKYKADKLKMLAGDYLKNLGAQVFSRNKPRISAGIEESAKQFFGEAGWQSLKKHAVQFTFANDRNEMVTPMGDIPGIVSACGSAGKNNLTGFEIRNGEAVIFDHYLDTLSLSDDHQEDQLDKASDKTYKQLVDIYMQKYNDYEACIDSTKDRLITRSQHTILGGNYASNSHETTILIKYLALIAAYAELWKAELTAHGAPVNFGLNKTILGEKYVNKSVFELITEKGQSVFYRKKNKCVMLKVPELLQKISKKSNK